MEESQPNPIHIHLRLPIPMCRFDLQLQRGEDSERTTANASALPSRRDTSTHREYTDPFTHIRNFTSDSDLPANTLPNDFANTSMGDMYFSPKCPVGFVVGPSSEDQDNSQLALWVRIKDTACYSSCLLPLWTKSEWRALKTVTTLLSSISLPVIIVVKKKKTASFD